MIYFSPIELPEVTQKYSNGVRYYKSKKSDDLYPSVTTVLYHEKPQGIIDWEKRIGEEEAAKILSRASYRGTKVHAIVEDYIQNKPLKLDDQMPNHVDLFKKIQRTIDEHIGNINVVEGKLISDYLKVGGTVDCIAEFDGKISIIDWKTSENVKKEEFIRKYYQQASSYAVMFEESTGIPIQDLVIICASEAEYAPQIFKSTRDEHIEDFMKVRVKYKEATGR